MNKFFLIFLSLTWLLNLTACSSLSQRECQLGDWYQMGLNEGQEGEKSRLATYSKDCAEYLVKVDSNLYNEGRIEGLNSYCTYENGKRVGKLKLSYNDVCPAESSGYFLLAYIPYYKLARAESELNSIEENIYYYQKKVNEDENKKESASHLKKAKSKLKYAKEEVKKYKLELKIKKLTREINQTDKERVANDSLSEEFKSSLIRQRNALVNKHTYYLVKWKAAKSIRSVKQIFDLF